MSTEQPPVSPAIYEAESTAQLATVSSTKRTTVDAALETTNVDTINTAIPPAGFGTHHSALEDPHIAACGASEQSTVDPALDEALETTQL